MHASTDMFYILRMIKKNCSILGSVVTITGLYVFLWGRKSETDQSVPKTLITTSKFCQKIENEAIKQ